MFRPRAIGAWTLPLQSALLFVAGVFASDDGDYDIFFVFE